MENKDSFGQWAIVELMGHVRVAGYVTEVKLFGSEMGRIDIPKSDNDMTTQFFGGSSIYRITPITEEVARMFSARNQPTPIFLYELALPDGNETDLDAI